MDRRSWGGRGTGRGGYGRGRGRDQGQHGRFALPQQAVPGDQQAYHSYQGGGPMGGLHGPGGDVADECDAPSTILDWSAPQCASQLSPSDRAAVDDYVQRYGTLALLSLCACRHKV